MAHVHFADPLEQQPSTVSLRFDAVNFELTSICEQLTDLSEQKCTRSILKPNLPTSSDTKRAGIEFPVGLVHEQLKSVFSPSYQINRETSVCLAAVLEYLVAEALHVAAMAAKEHSARDIRAVHLQRALNDDEELRCLVTGKSIDTSSWSTNREDSSYSPTDSSDSV